MKVIINPYHKSVTIDGVEVVQKFINFPDALNHLASISCDYDRDSQTITDVQDVHRYVSHAIEKQYYYKHLPEFVEWFYAEQQAQLDNAISVEQQIVAANTAAQNAATSAEKAKLEAEEAKKTNQNTQQAVDNAITKFMQAGGTLPVKANGTETARTLGERFADVVNVKDFGAKGDGVTDDTAAIQAALDAAVDGGIVFLPRANPSYRTTATLHIKRACTVFGATASVDGEPIILYEGTGRAILMGNYREEDHENITIRGGAIENISVCLTNDDSVGFCIHRTRDASWRNLTCIYKASNCTGFRFDGVAGGVFDCLFESLISLNSDSANIVHFDIVGSDASGNSGRVNANAFIRLSARGAGLGYRIGPSLINGFYSCLGEDLTDGYITFLSGANHNVFHDAYLGDNGNLEESAYIVDFQEGSVGNAIKNARFSGNGVFSLCRDLGSNNLIASLPNRVESGSVKFYNASSQGTSISREGVRTNLMQFKGGTSRNSADNIIGNGVNEEVDGTTYRGVNLLFSTTTLSPSFHDGTIADNYFSLGQANRRWKNIFAGTVEINTSDIREKTSITDPNESLMKAWSKVNFKTFQFTDAVEKKGEDARIHFGVIAQQVQEAFTSEGLDASRYALFCYDKWDDEYEDVEVIDVEATYDENGNELTPQISHTEKKLVTPAGDRYGIRYSEALALECAYQRWKLEKLEEKLAKLEV